MSIEGASATPDAHLSTKRPRPFLKWAGSKHALLHHITPLLPAQFNNYFEPFIGAGSVFLNIRPKRAFLSDLSQELIATWSAVKDAPEKIIAQLEGLYPNSERFYEIRANRASDPITRAAELVYLNKSCFNGLYRVNKNGDFNVPFGSNSKSLVIDSDNIRICSGILKSSSAVITACDFQESVKIAAEGDLVFFDPPYVTKHNFNGFRDYNEHLFSWADQERLAKEAARLRDLGVYVIVTNAAHADIKDLYKGFSTYEFDRASTIASKPGSRGRVSEVIFYG